MLRKSFPIILLITLVLMLVSLPAHAQDQLLFTNTPAPIVGTDPTVAPDAIVAPMPPVLEQPSSLFTPSVIGELLFLLGLSALAGGGIVAILLNFLNKKEVRDRVEDARNSWSPEQQQLLTNFTNLFERTTGGILDFLKSVQDGQPNAEVAGQSFTLEVNRDDREKAAQAVVDFAKAVRQSDVG